MHPSHRGASALTRWVASVLILVVGAGCRAHAQDLRWRLTSIYGGDCTIADVENALMLGRPKAVLEPEFPDPMQWRRYVLADGSIVDIAAAEDPTAPPGHDPMDGRFYSWTGIWVIGAGRVQDLAAHRQQTHYLPSGHSAADAPRRYREYFEGRDLSCPVTIARVEADLALPREAWRNLPATIFPL